MREIIKKYESYLLNDCGFTHETVEKYIGNLLIIIRKLNIISLADIKPEEISREWMYQFWDAIQSGKRLSDSTRKGYAVALKKFLQYLEEYGYPIPQGTAAKIKLPKQTEVHYEGLSYDEKKALRNWIPMHLKSVVDKRNAALIFFLWSTGCRISEALQLDVHADGIIYTDNPMVRSGSFFLARSKDTGQLNVYVHINGKGKRNRNIAVSPKAIAYINFYLENRGK